MSAETETAKLKKPKEIDSAWSPLRYEVFRALWIATIITNIGTWIQQVGATSLMTGINASATMIALVQTATSLPVFFLALPAGAIADAFDRRKLLILTQGWMLLAAALLAVLTYLDLTNGAALLAFTFAIGIGTAVSTPALQAVVPELVPRRELSAAVALSGVAINIARAVGPALGGLLIAATDVEVAFVVNALSFVAVIYVLATWQRPNASTDAQRLPPEPIFSAMRLSLRYLRHSPPLRAVLVRTFAFIFGGSALWALLPVKTQGELGTSPLGYGVLLGMIGAGALLGASFLPRLRALINTDGLVAAASLVFAVATIALAVIKNFSVLCVVLLAAGIAWIVLMSTFNLAAQIAVPAWIKARAIALYFIVFQGGMAMGSLFWGLLAESVDTSVALIAGGAVLAGGLITAWSFRLANLGTEKLEPARAWAMPQLAGEFGSILEDFEGDRRRVLVTIEYKVAPEKAHEFRRAMKAVREERLRDGAAEWHLAAEAEGSNVWIEVFIVPSWTEHLRQHERATESDLDNQMQARKFHIGNEPPSVKHYIVDRT